MSPQENPSDVQESVRNCVHSLRNHLGAILSGVRILQKAKDDSEVCDRTIQMVERNVQHSVDRLNEMMEVVGPSAEE